MEAPLRFCLSETLHITVLASGRGTNFRALIRSPLFERCVVDWNLLSDQPSAPVLELAKGAGVAAHVIARERFVSRDAWADALLTHLQTLRPDWIVLAGFMRILPATIVGAFDHKIINLHPSLLPRFKGLHAIEQTWRAHRSGATIDAGCTVHFVDEGMDTGEIIAQAWVPIRSDDDVEQLSTRVHETEHRLLPYTLYQLCSQQWRRGQAPMRFHNIEEIERASSL